MSYEALLAASVTITASGAVTKAISTAEVSAAEAASAEASVAVGGRVTLPVVGEAIGFTGALPAIVGGYERNVVLV